MISRTTPLIELLIRENSFSKDLLLMIWQNCIDEHRHEAVVKEILIVLIDLGRKMSSELLDIMFE